MCTPQFPYGLVAAPFFFIGSVLWVVVPCLGLNGDELTAYGVAVGAASCFLVDFVMLLMTRGDGIALLMGAYVVYGVACIGDVIAAGVDLVGGDSFWVGLLANISYTLSGAMAMMVCLCFVLCVVCDVVFFCFCFWFLRQSVMVRVPL